MIVGEQLRLLLDQMSVAELYNLKDECERRAGLLVHLPEGHAIMDHPDNWQLRNDLRGGFKAGEIR